MTIKYLNTSINTLRLKPGVAAGRFICMEGGIVNPFKFQTLDGVEQ
jgi:hypothetical protein